MATLGEVLRELRETIGLSRDELAAATGVSSSLIYKTETDASYKAKKSTSIRLVRAMQSEAAKRGIVVPPDRWSELLEAAGLPSGAANVAQRAAIDQVNREVGVRERDTADERRCRDLLADLIQRRGAAAVLKLLESAMAFAADEQGGAESDDEKDTRSVRVAHPPVQRDGYVEQTIVHYEDRSAESQARKPKPKARRAGG